jgi:methionyl-tRNA formyltransferase
MSLRILYAGTPTFAIAPLIALNDAHYALCGVCTQMDKPAGRGQQLSESPVKAYAQTHHIPIFQPKSCKNSDFLAQIAELKPDLCIVVAYGQILPQSFLDLPRLGCINIHASLLPKWRGAAPIQRALLAGDAETGVALMRIEAGLDTGAVYATAHTPISATDTAQSLHDRLSHLGAELLLEYLPKLETMTPIAQDHTQASYAHKINKIEGFIDWQQNAAQIDRQIRAFNPWPIAYTHLNGESVRIHQAHILDQKAMAAPGTIVQAEGDHLWIATSDRVLAINRLQLAGSKALSTADLLRGKANLFQRGTRLG